MVRESLIKLHIGCCRCSYTAIVFWLWVLCVCVSVQDSNQCRDYQTVWRQDQRKRKCTKVCFEFWYVVPFRVVRSSMEWQQKTGNLKFETWHTHTHTYAVFAALFLCGARNFHSIFVSFISRSCAAGLSPGQRALRFPVFEIPIQHFHFSAIFFVCFLHLYSIFISYFVRFCCNSGHSQFPFNSIGAKSKYT